MSKSRRDLLLGLAFLSPNILGFLVFTLVPLVMSFVLAFSNWDLRLHNMFKHEPIRFVGLENFRRLLREPDFLRFLGNTLFLMMGIPLTIAGNLVLAMFLSKDLGGGRGRARLWLVVGMALLVSCATLSALGAGATAMTLLLLGAAGVILLAGVAGGSTIYRTLFYVPHFTSGVAVFILWKKIYSPSPVGPISNFLGAPHGPLAWVSGVVRAAPAPVVQSGMWICLALAALMIGWGLRWLRRSWEDGELGIAAAVVPVALLALPIILAGVWLPRSASIALIAVAGAASLWQLARCRRGRPFSCRAGVGLGSAVMLAGGLMVVQLILIGLGMVLHDLPACVAQAGAAGLKPPDWLNSYHWAKPALMIMGFWGALGSGNMLLYLAALSNVPPELYEAADMDGAGRFRKFWHITWPQLAPTTFFIVIMSVMGGLQGGFETARTMTRGGPAGSTTTLSYFVYTEGFETGRLGYSSAVAWTLFAMIFVVTLFNWRFGNRYVND